MRFDHLILLPIAFIVFFGHLVSRASAITANSRRLAGECPAQTKKSQKKILPLISRVFLYSPFTTHFRKST